MMPPVLSGRTRIVVNAILFGFVLRALGLDALSLWVDEGVTHANATEGGWRDTFFAESNHPPVWWLLTRAWLAIWPGEEASLRAPAVACSLLALVLLWRVLLRLCDPARAPRRGGFRGGVPGEDGATATWVVVLASVNPFLIEYAQEARMYSALLAESLGLTLLYLRWLDRPEEGAGRGTLVAYAALASVALHTNYFALWPVAGHLAHALLVAREARRRGTPTSVRPLVAAQAAAGLSFVPWFVYMLSAYRGISPGEYEPFGRLAHAVWRMAVGPALVALDAPRVRAGPAAVFAEEPVLIVVSALLFLVPVALGFVVLWRKDRGGARFALGAIVVPVALVMAACVRWPLVHEKYLIFVAPFLLWVAVVGARGAPRALRPLLLGGLVLVHVAGTAAYHFGHVPALAPLVGKHRYGKEQWREAHDFVARTKAPGDVVLLHAPFTKTAWDFYEGIARGPAAGPRAPGRVLPPAPLPVDRALSADEVIEAVPDLASARGAFLVVSHPSTDDPDHYPAAFLRALATVWEGFSLERHDLPLQWGVRILHARRGTSGRGG